jgi:hypothetical protein
MFWLFFFFMILSAIMECNEYSSSKKDNDMFDNFL